MVEHFHQPFHQPRHVCDFVFKKLSTSQICYKYIQWLTEDSRNNTDELSADRSSHCGKEFSRGMQLHFKDDKQTLNEDVFVMNQGRQSCDYQYVRLKLNQLISINC